MQPPKPDTPVGDETAVVFSGWVALDQGFQLMLVITPTEAFRWHPEAEATLFYDDDTSEPVTVARTARAKTVKANQELYVSADRAQDPSTPRVLRYLALTNRGVQVQIWESDAFDRRAKAKATK